MNDNDILLPMDLVAEFSMDQFRVREIQLYNWGTFSDLHVLPVADKGHAVLGPSGAGKSTILDAKTALLSPANMQEFNTAANEGSRDRERSLLSYVRGTWSKKSAEGNQRGSEARVLRDKTTYSALAMKMGSARGGIITLVQLFWVRGATMRKEDVKRYYMVFDREINLDDLQFFGETDFDLVDLRKRLAPLRHHGDSGAAYHDEFCRLCGIKNHQALKLLHKAQATKNIGDLNKFMRELMLDEPGTFKIAKQLIEEFANLNDSYLAVQKARRQIEILLPARQAKLDSDAAKTELSKVQEFEAGMDYFVAEKRDRLLQEAILIDLSDIETTNQRMERARLEKESAEQQLHELRAELNKAGGTAIEGLKLQIKSKQELKNRRLSRRRKIEGDFRQLKLELPDDEAAYAKIAGEARARSGNIHETLSSSASNETALLGERRDIDTKVKTAVESLRALDGRKSNISAPLLMLRAMMEEKLGVEPGDLLFAGELIEVKKEEAEWRPALERLLGGLSTSLLVPKNLYSAVRKFVNDNHLRNNLTYYAAHSDAKSPEREIKSDRAACLKVDVTKGIFKDWLTTELAYRFNHICVETLSELSEHEFAVTKEGQVRGGRSKHEKRDKFNVTDQSQWTLGGDNSNKKSLLQKAIAELQRDGKLIDQKLGGVREQREQATTSYAASNSIAETTWTDIDVVGLDREIDELNKSIESIRSPEIAALEKRVTEQSNRATQKAEDLGGLKKDLQGQQATLNRHKSDLDKLRSRADIVECTPTQKEGLEFRFAATGKALTLANLDSVRLEVGNSLTRQGGNYREEIQRLRGELERCFVKFKSDWPMDAADMDSTIASTDAYLAVLASLEHDKLPAYETRFFDLLQNRSVKNLAGLSATITKESTEIDSKIEAVNQALEPISYRRKSYLQIHKVRLNSQAVIDFRSDLKAAIENVYTASRAEQEQRFVLIKKIVERLQSTKTEDERWRETVLDVRQHVEFGAREFSRETREELQYYEGTGAKSGGQRQLLSMFCLAAALRFQMCGRDTNSAPPLASLVLDEAFDKADHEYTTNTMTMFQSFGFQVILATPLKAVTSFEPFIGGAMLINIRDDQASTAKHMTVEETMKVAKKSRDE